jgi:hypothetical protein
MVFICDNIRLDKCFPFDTIALITALFHCVITSPSPSPSHPGRGSKSEAPTPNISPPLVGGAGGGGVRVKLPPQIYPLPWWEGLGEGEPQTTLV